MKGLMILIICFAIIAGCASENPPDRETSETDYDAWVDSKCGRCHEASEYTHLLEITKNMESDDFEKLLAGMVHGDLRLSDSDISEALEYFRTKGLLYSAQ